MSWPNYVNFVNEDYEYMLVETKSIIASTILWQMNKQFIQNRTPLKIQSKLLDN